MLETLTEWQTYIQGLAGPALRSKAIAANTPAFASLLLDEGKDLSYLMAILKMFVQQMVATGMKIPQDGVYDLMAMRLEVPQERIPASQVSALKLMPVEEPPDEVDALAASAELEAAWSPDELLQS